MDMNNLIETIVYMIYEEDVEMNDPEETIKQIKIKLSDKKLICDACKLGITKQCTDCDVYNN